MVEHIDQRTEEFGLARERSRTRQCTREHDQYTPEGLEQSISLYRHALAIDPNYAAAWIGLARSYRWQADLGWRPIDEGNRMDQDLSEIVDVNAELESDKRLQRIGWGNEGIKVLHRGAVPQEGAEPPTTQPGGGRDLRARPRCALPGAAALQALRPSRC